MSTHYNSVKFSVGLDLVFYISTPSQYVNSITSNFSIKLFLLYYLIIIFLKLVNTLPNYFSYNIISNNQCSALGTRF
uniref:Putative ovule protein n=1 Tax=Solanum chacoense TaxID=4108 RepID=A0A0V0HWE7_SOLCH